MNGISIFFYRFFGYFTHKIRLFLVSTHQIKLFLINIWRNPDQIPFNIPSSLNHIIFYWVFFSFEINQTKIDQSFTFYVDVVCIYSIENNHFFCRSYYVNEVYIYYRYFFSFIMFEFKFYEVNKKLVNKKMVGGN